MIFFKVGFIVNFTFTPPPWMGWPEQCTFHGRPTFYRKCWVIRQNL